jgi:hypothetical protein
MTAMKRSNDLQAPLPMHDYELALQRAVSWLGDRHLLATPSVRLATPNIRHRFLTRPLASATRIGTDPAMLVH